MRRITGREDGERIDLKPVPAQMVFEVSGPMFFGAADKIAQIPLDSRRMC